MRVLVTGGAGYIGSCVARALLERGDEVVVLDNLLTGFRDRVPEGAGFIEADLRDAEAVRAATSGVEVVYHQAALRSVPRSVDKPVLATECNVLGTLNVLIAAADAGVRRVVYASSSSVYGQTAKTPMHEDDVADPISPYAASKLAGELYCRVWTRLHGLSTVSLRYFNVFGPGQSLESKYALVFPAFTSALVAGQAPRIEWDGEQAKDFTYIDDIVRANLLAGAASEDVDGSVINIGNGAPKTVNEVLREISNALDVWIEPEHVPARAGDVRLTHADISRAAELLGWKPETPFSTAVERTAEWFRDGDR